MKFFYFLIICSLSKMGELKYLSRGQNKTGLNTLIFGSPVVSLCDDVAAVVRPLAGPWTISFSCFACFGAPYLQ
jgi:hypothetical protein